MTDTPRKIPFGLIELESCLKRSEVEAVMRGEAELVRLTPAEEARRHRELDEWEQTGRTLSPSFDEWFAEHGSGGSIFSMEPRAGAPKDRTGAERARRYRQRRKLSRGTP